MTWVADQQRKVQGTVVDSKGRGIFILRAGLGLGFLFAGLDKFFMWASGTPFTSAGYLVHATSGSWLGSAATAVVNPTHGFWVSLAGNASLVSVIDTLVVFGECAIGIALVLGLATRFAAVMGTLLMAMLYISNWSFATGPFNEQFMYGLIAITIAYVGAGAYALDTVVAKLAIANRIPVVKYALG
ncbi:MAG: DoxX family protein [Candidatus Limnocylindrales bacterium]|jgi:thiosulfate dehydrogenase [quinone] large subunit